MVVAPVVRSDQASLPALDSEVEHLDQVIGSSGLEGRPVHAEEMSWLMHRSCSLGLPAPRNMPAVPGAEWEPEDLASFTDAADFHAEPYAPTLTVRGRTGSNAGVRRHLAVLTVGQMHGLQIPEVDDPWVQHADRTSNHGLDRLRGKSPRLGGVSRARGPADLAKHLDHASAVTRGSAATKRYRSVDRSMIVRKIMWISGVVIVVGFLGLCGWGIFVNKDATWWGALGQWVGGIGSIVAAVVALWIAREGWRRVERERREEEMIQAELVQYDGFNRYDTVDSAYSNASITIHNRSGSYVMDVELVAVQHRGEIRIGDWYLVGACYVNAAGESVTPELTSAPGKEFNEVFSRVSPEERVRFYVTFRLPDARSEIPEIGPIVTFSYMDARGRRWTRTDAERPTRTQPGDGFARREGAPMFSHIVTRPPELTN